jgi:signal transduction histidine kinase
VSTRHRLLRRPAPGLILGGALLLGCLAGLWSLARLEAAAALAGPGGRVTLLLLGVLGGLGGLLIGAGVVRARSAGQARLSVLLRHADTALVEDIGTVEVCAESGPGALEQRVEQIIERLRGIIEEANGTHQEARRTEQLAAVGRLADQLAHEIRSPLTGIRMLIDVARQSPAEGLTGEDLQVILSGVERIDRRVQGLLDDARAPARPRRVDLRDAVGQALRLIGTRLEQQGITPEVRLPDRPLPIEVDEDRFSGVLVNLFLGALDAMPPRARLGVELSAGDPLVLTVLDATDARTPRIRGRLAVPVADRDASETSLSRRTAPARRNEALVAS